MGKIGILFRKGDLDPQTLVQTNAPLIEKAASLIREAGAEPMTANEARALLGIGA